MSETLMPIALVAGLCIFGAMLWRWNTEPNNNFNLLDFICKDGRASISKTGQFAALCVSTWGFVYLTLAGKLSESYFSLYIATWAAAKAVDKGLDILAANKQGATP